VRSKRLPFPFASSLLHAPTLCFVSSLAFLPCADRRRVFVCSSEELLILAPASAVRDTSHLLAVGALSATKLVVNAGIAPVRAA
jgi:hypothetical protein